MNRSPDPLDQNTYVTGRADPLTEAELRETILRMDRELRVLRARDRYRQGQRDRFVPLPASEAPQPNNFYRFAEEFGFPRWRDQFRQQINGTWDLTPPRPQPKTLAADSHWSR